MTAKLHEMLLWWRQEQKEILGHTPEYVFVCLSTLYANRDLFGKPYVSRQHFMERLCDKANVKRFGFHGIRHMVAFQLYEIGRSLAFIQRFLRHKSPTTTVRYLRTLGCKDIREGVEMGLGADQLRSTAETFGPYGETSDLQAGQEAKSELIATGNSSVIDFASAIQSRKA